MEATLFLTHVKVIFNGHYICLLELLHDLIKILSQKVKKSLSSYLEN